MKPILKLGCLALLSLPVLPALAQTTVTRISAGYSFSLFTKSDGSLWDMGYNSSFGPFDAGSIFVNTNLPQLIGIQFCHRGCRRRQPCALPDAAHHRLA